MPLRYARRENVYEPQYGWILFKGVGRPEDCLCSYQKLMDYLVMSPYPCLFSGKIAVDVIWVAVKDSNHHLQ